MTISSTEALVSGPYSGDGVTVVFDYDFKIYADAELIVKRQNADGTTTTLALTTNYTVAGAGDTGGGSITLVSGATLPAGATLTIEPDITASQERPFSSQSSISLLQVENALDKLTSFVRQVLGLSKRALKVAAGQPYPDDLPTAAAGKALIWNAGGTGLENGPTASEITSAQGYATAASGYADEAMAWATTAEDVEVAAGLFSSLHWATKAAASAAAAATFDPANFQPIDAALTSLAGLTLAANKGLYSTAADTVALYDLTAAGLALLDDADAAAQLVTLGLGSRITETVTVIPADLDTIAENGYFQAINTTLNTPLPSLFWEGFSWASSGGVVRRQLIWRRFSTELYHRRYVSGAWSTWVRLPNTSEVFGIDQTWQNMVGSRAYGTSYQNTTGKPIIVAAYSVSGSTRAERAQVSSDGVTWLTLKEVPSGTFVGDLSISDKVIPNGWYYRIVLVSGTAPTITAWMELR